MGNALAGFGRGYAFFSAVITTVLGIIMIILGLYFLTSKKQTRNRQSGLALVAFGIFIILLSWILVWATRKSKTVAELEGGYGAYEIAKDIF